jgi:ATP phosphoribosyltransferase
MLTFALPKGRNQAPLLQLLGELGPTAGDLASRRLVLERDALRFLPLKDADIAAYVERGTADLGVVGSDLLVEEEADVLEPLDLGLGRCILAIAGLPGLDLAALHARGTLKVGTRYPRTTARSLAGRGLAAEVIPLSGSVEVSVLTGLADCIVDLVETGRTLRENGLVVHETLMQVSARVVVNRAAFRLPSAEVQAVLHTLRRRALEAGYEAA